MKKLKDIIPKGKKRLLKTLNEAGFNTLEDCAKDPPRMRNLRGVGNEAVLAIKDHCFKNGIVWAGLDQYVKEVSHHLVKRHKIPKKEAEKIATIFFWESVTPHTLWGKFF